MDEQGFRAWLEQDGQVSATISSRISDVRRVERHYGDLDAAHDGDRFAAILKDLAYSGADKAAGKDNSSRLQIDGDLYNGLSSLRSALSTYARFRSEGNGSRILSPRPDRAAVEQAMMECDRVGLDAFMADYGFSQSNIRYCVRHAGRTYPSKAIFGVAHRFMPGGIARDSETCDGTEARKHLAKLGFAIVGNGPAGSTAIDPPTGDRARQGQLASYITPTNLILYGPPGTGKTYATAREAVRLCNGSAPEDRGELMGEYARLAAAGRIEFVTFHQSYSYEDFVEGLRPTQVGEDGEQLAAGFRLAPDPGVFKRIATRALALGRQAKRAGFEIGDRKIFKMSLGEVANPADNYLFQEAINGGYVLLGDDGGMDWSQPQFTSKRAMIEGYAAAHPDEPGLSPLHGLIEFPFTLKNRVRQGDLFIVSKGNLAFRAIAEVVGDYEQVERENDDYTMHRAVRWLWIDEAGQPYDLINNKRFSQRTIYELSRSELKLDALQALIDATQSEEQGENTVDKPFVLIIDEINRANISKVFGELITLLESDKRLGQSNALSVRLPYSGEVFGVPSNLHVIGTMNTADRSIALLDTALRRRFQFRELMPEPELLAESVDGVPLRAMLRALNERIEYLFDREHQIGHAYFMGCTSRADVDAVMRDKVIPLLQEYFYEDWSKVALVLGDADGAGRFLRRVPLKPPPGLGDDGAGGDRYRWSVRDDFGDGVYAQFE